MEEKRKSVSERRVPTQIRRRKGPPVWRDTFATLEQVVSGNSRERSQEVSILSKNPDGEALSRILNLLSDERNLRDPHLKHYHMSTAQFKKRTAYWTFLEGFVTFTSMWSRHAQSAIRHRRDLTDRV